MDKPLPTEPVVESLTYSDPRNEWGIDYLYLGHVNEKIVWDNACEACAKYLDTWRSPATDAAAAGIRRAIDRRKQQTKA